MSIAAAVDEQGAATAEIARNVQQTARSAQDVTANIGGVSQAANGHGGSGGPGTECGGGPVSASGTTDQRGGRLHRRCPGGVGVRAAQPIRQPSGQHPIQQTTQPSGNFVAVVRRLSGQIPARNQCLDLGIADIERDAAQPGPAAFAAPTHPLSTGTKGR